MASVLNRYFEWRIERKLAHSSLDALLDAMSDRRYFFPHNVLRPFYNSLYESKKSIGWFATRCAERLKDAGLNNCEYPGVEQVLLDAFLSDKDEHVKNMVVASLRTVGTSRSLTVLKEKLKNTREAKARYYLESAIEAIEERVSGN